MYLYINGFNTYVFLPKLFELFRQSSTTHLIVFILFKLFYQVIPTKNKIIHTCTLILLNLLKEQKTIPVVSKLGKYSCKL